MTEFSHTSSLLAVMTLTLLLPNPLTSFAEPPPPAARVCAGAYYFDGWTGETDPIHLTPRLRNEFADREPVWGWRDGSLDIVEKQIACAADHGLAFFAFDWYWPQGTNKYSPLNTGLKLYLQATNKQRLQFCLMVANHGGFDVGPADWDTVNDIWIRLFKEPTYLKVDGKPLLIFFLPGELRRDFGSSGAVKAAFDQLNAKARSAGLAGVCIAACARPNPERHGADLAELQADGYACLTGYNYVSHPKQGSDRIQPYSRLIEAHQDIWDRFAAQSPLPYMPAITVGWDRRPWEDPSKPQTQAVYYPDRTPLQTTDFVRQAIRWLNDHADKTTKERILLLYAWNENGEGGYLTPTKGLGDTYLKAVGNVLNANK